MPSRPRPAVKCTGRKNDGEPCGKYAVEGATVCEQHGGSAPQVKSAGRKQASLVRARRTMERYGQKRDIGPTEALLEEVQWTAGHVVWLRERVQEVEESQLVWGKIQHKTGGEDWGVTEAAAPNMWLKLYQEERTHLARVCEAAIRCGIEERRVRLAESQGALVAEMLRAILADLNLSDEQQAAAPAIVVRHLRALTAA